MISSRHHLVNKQNFKFSESKFESVNGDIYTEVLPFGSFGVSSTIRVSSSFLNFIFHQNKNKQTKVTFQAEKRCCWSLRKHLIPPA